MEEMYGNGLAMYGAPLYRCGLYSQLLQMRRGKSVKAVRARIYVAMNNLDHTPAVFTLQWSVNIDLFLDVQCMFSVYIPSQPHCTYSSTLLARNPSLVKNHSGDVYMQSWG